MMYQIKEVILHNKSIERKVLIIEFEDPRLNIVGEFLMTDASLVDYSVVDEIAAVLAGQKDYAESGGNRCLLEIKADYTIISDLLEGMFDGFDTFESYQMETKQLLDLIIIWKKALKKFQAERYQ